MTGQANVVTRLFMAMQRRDWDAAAACLDPAAVIEWPATGERFDAAAFIAMNRAYPDGWSIAVVDVLEHRDRIAARVRVTHGTEVFWCAGFYDVSGGRITHGVEHWLTEGGEEPPGWRAPFRS